jgi:hypothetical protein
MFPRGILLLMAAVLAGSVSCSSEEEFPTGRWMTTGYSFTVITDFRDGGSVVVYGGPSALQAEQLVTGTYEVSGDELQLIEDSGCGEVSGTYIWELVDEGLRTTLVEDDCEDRREGFDGVVLTAMDVGDGGPASADPVVDPVLWWNEQTFYEVSVRRFADSDGDGNGELQGLIDRLDYLNDGDPAEHEALRTGGLQALAASCPNGYAFTRSSADGSDNLLVVLNFGGSTAECTFSAASTGIPEGAYLATGALSGEAAADLRVGDDGEIADYAPTADAAAAPGARAGASADLLNALPTPERSKINLNHDQCVTTATLIMVEIDLAGTERPYPGGWRP